jgi:hypothetical protein
VTDVLLTHGYVLDEDPKEREVMKPYPPLGLLYVTAYLRREGIAAEVFDTTFSSRDALAARLDAGPAGVLGVYTNLITRRSVLDVVARAKARGWTVVLGGPEAANYPAEYLARGADVVVASCSPHSMRGARTGCTASRAPRSWTSRAPSSRIPSGPRFATSTPFPGLRGTRSICPATSTSGAPITGKAV